MIDTLVINGNADFYRFEKDYTKYQVFKMKSGKEFIPIVEVQKGDFIRIHFTPADNRLKIELNVSKILFGSNSINYDYDSTFLNKIIRSFGDYFFKHANYHVSRVDIGYVHLLQDRETLVKVLERYRSTKPDSQRAHKRHHQTYQNSVFYSTKDYSIKVYAKGDEMRYKHYEFGDSINYSNMLRYEKTYRFRAWSKMMPIEKSKGTHIDSFDVSLLVDDFKKTFTKWEASGKDNFAKENNFTGIMGTLARLDALGQLDTVHGVVSRTTLHRYKKMRLRYNFLSTENESFMIDKEKYLNDLQQKVLSYAKRHLHLCVQSAVYNALNKTQNKYFSQFNL